MRGSLEIRAFVTAGLAVTGTDQIKRTPLHDVHVAAGGRMVDFAGWRMPVQYSGVIDEHRAVRERVGLFDVSHMGEAGVRGSGALDFLQFVTCNDVSRLAPGRAQYTALTTPAGTFVDDLLVYRLAADEFLLVVNAANTPKDLAWLRTHAGRFDVTLDDESSRWAQIAVQGPAARPTLTPLAGDALGDLKYYRFALLELLDHRCLVSRTGYTGEVGYEIYAPAAAAPELWGALLRAGGEFGILPAGLGARDTLRLEAALALYGQDIDDTTTVVEADLGWIVKPDKGPFLGRDVLKRQLETGAERKLVGFELQGKGIARHGHAARHEGRPVGRVTSGTRSPTLGKSLGLVYLPRELTEPGTAFDIDIRGRAEPAVVVPTPFYKRPKQRV